MLIGIISDTDGNLPLIEKAIKKLNEENVALVLHAGDYISPFVIAKFKTLNAPLIGVFGNNDGDHEFLRKTVQLNPKLHNTQQVCRSQCRRLQNSIAARR